MLFFSGPSVSFLLIGMIVLAALASFGSPYFGFGINRPYIYYGGGLALFVLLLLLIFGAHP